jgi:MFS family permease
MGRARARIDASVAPFRVLRHRNFALVATGNFINQLGLWARIIGIGWAAQELTHSPTLIGVAFGAQFIPSLFLGPVGGLVADHHDRRLISILGNLGMTVPTLAIALLLRSGSLTLLDLILLALAGGVLQSFTQPAMTAVIPRLVPTEEVQSAVALNSMASNVSRFVGSALVGVVIAAFGTAGAFLFNAGAFILVIFTWLAVDGRLTRPPEMRSDTTGCMRRLADGFEYARNHATIRSLLFLNVVVTFLIVQQPLLPLVASRVLDSGASAYGLLNSATGLGAVVGAFTVGRIATDRGRKVAIATGVVTTGVCVVAIGLSRSVPLSVCLQALYGFGFFVVTTVAMTILTLTAPDRVRGRIMGLYTMSVMGIVPLNALAAGFLASWLGVTATILLAGAILLIYAAWFVTFRLQVVQLVVDDEDEILITPVADPAGTQLPGPVQA